MICFTLQPIGSHKLPLSSPQKFTSISFIILSEYRQEQWLGFQNLVKNISRFSFDWKLPTIPTICNLSARRPPGVISPEAFLIRAGRTLTTTCKGFDGQCLISLHRHTKEKIEAISQVITDDKSNPFSSGIGRKCFQNSPFTLFTASFYFEIFV